MTFDDFKSQVLETAHRACLVYGSAPPAGHDDDRASKVIAAAAKVIARRSPDWCLANARAFATDVKQELGVWVNIALMFASVFGGSGVWISLLKWLLPAVLELLGHMRRPGFATGEPVSWIRMSQEAEAVLKGSPS